MFLSSLKIDLDIEDYLQLMKRGCGPICDDSIPTINSDDPSLPPFVKKPNVDCKALWKNRYNDLSQFDPPPLQIPSKMKHEYLYQMKVKESPR